MLARNILYVSLDVFDLKITLGIQPQCSEKNFLSDILGALCYLMIPKNTCVSINSPEKIFTSKVLAR